MRKKHRITLAILMVFPMTGFSQEYEAICPLSKSHILGTLHAIKRLTNENSSVYPATLHEHVLRMSGEVLKIDEYAELKAQGRSEYKSCTYYWIGVAMSGIERAGSNEVRAAMRKELEMEVNKCIDWVTAHRFADDSNIMSIQCK